MRLLQGTPGFIKYHFASQAQKIGITLLDLFIIYEGDKNINGCQGETLKYLTGRISRYLGKTIFCQISGNNVGMFQNLPFVFWDI